MSSSLENNHYNIKTEDGFRHLFDEFYPSMYHYANKLVGNEVAADDLTQEVFMNLWDKREELEIQTYAGFLYTSIRHRCMNYLRAEQRRTIGNARLQQKNEGKVEDRILLIEEEVVRHIKKLLSEMPEQRRKVFELHMEGYSQQEIADKLDVSVNTIKTHKLKARQFLKAQLKNTLGFLLLFQI
ncbi:MULTISPECIES: RNA polymerase sigma-70 factor [unclassified Saccharicrinis]|uniref:RNA polymerase sigma-70 factor n=1 Tax=unclassified Saccharicrinis TaxID=2646859 RepID=UPI003D32EEA1